MADDISAMIRTIRRQRSLSQEELARVLGVSFPTVNAWERGKSQPYPRHQRAIEELHAAVLLAAGRHQVLIVEDDPNAGMILADYVAMALPDWESVVIDNGYEAILKIGLVQPAVVLLDIMMPKIDGFEVFEKVRQQPDLAATRIVFVTAATDEAILRRARESGAFALIQKPLDRAEVTAVLRRAAGMDTA